MEKQERYEQMIRRAVAMDRQGNTDDFLATCGEHGVSYIKRSGCPLCNKDRQDLMDEYGTAMEQPMKSDGGPTGYYDLDPSWVTMNDMMEHRAKSQWKEYSLHFKDIEKALARFRMKEGTSDLYDLKKIAYSSIRALGMSIGKDGVRDYLQQLLDDPQFK